MQLSKSLTGVLAILVLLTATAASSDGCSGKTGTKGVFRPATKTRPANDLTSKLIAGEHTDVYALAAKAKIYTESNAGTISATANMIWLRDSVLWINVRKFGVEAVRALITPDSMFIIYRLEQQYTAKSLAALEKQYSLPEGFPLLQHLLLASAWISPEVQFQADIRDSLHRLSGANHRYALDYRVEEGTFLLRKALFFQPQEARSLALDFERYGKLSGIGQFPYLRRIEAYSPEDGQMRLDIEFTEIEINVPRPYRFEIPEHYRLAN
jgi:hypothetical protein